MMLICEESWKIQRNERKYKHLHQQMNILSLRWLKKERENDENVWKSNQKALVVPLHRVGLKFRGVDTEKNYLIFGEF
jgi:hypothetical protein